MTNLNNDCLVNNKVNLELQIAIFENERRFVERFIREKDADVLTIDRFGDNLSVFVRFELGGDTEFDRYTIPMVEFTEWLNNERKQRA